MDMHLSTQERSPLLYCGLVVLYLKEGACIDYDNVVSAGLTDFYITLPYTLTIG